MQVSRFRHSPPSDNKCRLIGFGLAAESRIAESNSGRTCDARMVYQLMPVAFGACSHTVSMYRPHSCRVQDGFSPSPFCWPSLLRPSSRRVDHWRERTGVMGCVARCTFELDAGSVQLLWQGVGPWCDDHRQGRADLHQGAVSEEEFQVGRAIRAATRRFDRDR